MELNEASRRKRRSINRNSAEANTPSFHEFQQGRLSIHSCGKQDDILVKANKATSGTSIDISIKMKIPGNAPNFKQLIRIDSNEKNHLIKKISEFFKGAIAGIVVNTNKLLNRSSF